MKATAATPRAAQAVERADQDRTQQRARTAMPSLAELRATLSEAYVNIQVVEKALISNEKAEDDSYRALWEACAKGDEIAVNSILATGLKVNRKNQDGVTLLHLAASNGYDAVVRVLLDYGAEIDARLGPAGSALGTRFAGATPWFLAKCNSKDLVAEFLASRGADANASTDQGCSACEILKTVRQLPAGSLNLRIGRY